MNSVNVKETNSNWLKYFHLPYLSFSYSHLFSPSFLAALNAIYPSQLCASPLVSENELSRFLFSFSEGRYTDYKIYLVIFWGMTSIL